MNIRNVEPTLRKLAGQYEHLEYDFRRGYMQSKTNLVPSGNLRSPQYAMRRSLCMGPQLWLRIDHSISISSGVISSVRAEQAIKACSNRVALEYSSKCSHDLMEGIHVSFARSANIVEIITLHPKYRTGLPCPYTLCTVDYFALVI